MLQVDTDAIVSIILIFTSFSENIIEWIVIRGVDATFSFRLIVAFFVSLTVTVYRVVWLADRHFVLRF